MRRPDVDERYSFLMRAYGEESRLALRFPSHVHAGSARTEHEIAAKRRRLQRHSPIQKPTVPHLLCDFDGQQWPCPDIRDDLDVAAGRAPGQLVLIRTEH